MAFDCELCEPPASIAPPRLMPPIYVVTYDSLGKHGLRLYSAEEPNRNWNYFRFSSGPIQGLRPDVQRFGAATSVGGVVFMGTWWSEMPSTSKFAGGTVDVETRHNLYRYTDDGIPEPMLLIGSDFATYFPVGADGLYFSAINGNKFDRLKQSRIVDMVEADGAILVYANLLFGTANQTFGQAHQAIYRVSTGGAILAGMIRQNVPLNWPGAQFTRVFTGDDGVRYLANGVMNEFALFSNTNIQRGVINPIVSDLSSNVIDVSKWGWGNCDHWDQIRKLRAISAQPYHELVQNPFVGAGDYTAYFIDDASAVTLEFRQNAIDRAGVNRKTKIRTFQDATEYTYRDWEPGDISIVSGPMTATEIATQLNNSGARRPVTGGETVLMVIESGGNTYPIVPQEYSYSQEFGRSVTEPDSRTVARITTYGLRYSSLGESGLPGGWFGIPGKNTHPDLYDAFGRFLPDVFLDSYGGQYLPAWFDQSAYPLGYNLGPLSGASLLHDGAPEPCFVRRVQVANNTTISRIRRPPRGENVWQAMFSSGPTPVVPAGVLTELYDTWGRFHVTDITPSIEEYVSGEITAFYVRNHRGQWAKLVRDGSFASVAWVSEFPTEWRLNPSDNYGSPAIDESPGSAFSRRRAVIRDGKIHTSTLQPLFIPAWAWRIVGDWSEFTVVLKFGDYYSPPFSWKSDQGPLWQVPLLEHLNRWQVLRGSLTTNTLGPNFAYVEDRSRYWWVRPVGVPAGAEVVSYHTDGIPEQYDRGVTPVGFFMSPRSIPVVDEFTTDGSATFEISTVRSGADVFGSVVIDTETGDVLSYPLRIFGSYVLQPGVIETRGGVGCADWTPVNNEFLESFVRW